MALTFMNNNKQLVFLKKQAFSLLNTGHLSQAKIHCQNYCNQQPNDPEGWCLLSVINGTLKSFNESVYFAKKAISLSPKYIVPHFNLGAALFNLGNADAAITEFKIVLKLNPEHGIAYFLMGKCYELLPNKVDEAMSCYKKAMKLLPQPHRELLQATAGLYEKIGKDQESLACVQKILDVYPQDLQANLLMAKLEQNDGCLDKSRARLELLRNAGNSVLGEERDRVLNQLGHVLDRLGEYDDAYDAHEESQQAAREKAGTKFDGQIWHDRINQHMEATTPSKIVNRRIAHGNNKLPAPIFLVGFPRSGTTLTEHIVSSDPQIQPSYENNILRKVVDKNQGLIYNEKLNIKQLEDLRSQYWDSAEKLCYAAPGKKQFLDKLPLNIVNMNFINMIFPDAKILLLIRDPRDVCLSCFMQLFRPNNAMVNFFDLKSTAQFYNSTMRLWQHYESVMNLELYKLYYEDLVGDFEFQTKKLFSFLELDWRKEVLEYHKQKKHSVATPSYSDIAQPVYTRASGRWRNYKSQLQPVMGLLQPYIEAFGYDSDNSS